MPGTKIPESVLVVIHTPQLEVLLLERADHRGFWQSVTGSRANADERLEQTCRREVAEETGIEIDASGGPLLLDWDRVNRYEIYPSWRHRYPPGVTYNTEHVFGLVLPWPVPVRLAPREHVRYAWLDWRDAAERCFSWTNAEAIRELPRRHAATPHK